MTAIDYVIKHATKKLPVATVSYSSGHHPKDDYATYRLDLPPEHIADKDNDTHAYITVSGGKICSVQKRDCRGIHFTIDVNYILHEEELMFLLKNITRIY